MKLFKDDFINFLGLPKVAGGDTGHGGTPRPVSHQPQYVQRKFHF